MTSEIQNERSVVLARFVESRFAHLDQRDPHCFPEHVVPSRVQIPFRAETHRLTGFPGGQVEHSGTVIAQRVPFSQDREIVTENQHLGVERQIEGIAVRILAVSSQRIFTVRLEYQQPDGKGNVDPSDERRKLLHALSRGQKDDVEWTRDVALIFLNLTRQLAEASHRGQDTHAGEGPGPSVQHRRLVQI